MAAHRVAWLSVPFLALLLLSCGGRDAADGAPQQASGASAFFGSASPGTTPVFRLPTAAAPGPSGSNCDPSYPTVCIPSPPPDLDCGDIPYRRFPVRPPDPHRFDRDGDGIGCER